MPRPRRSKAQREQTARVLRIMHARKRGIPPNPEDLFPPRPHHEQQVPAPQQDLPVVHHNESPVEKENASEHPTEKRSLEDIKRDLRNTLRRERRLRDSNQRLKAEARALSQAVAQTHEQRRQIAAAHATLVREAEERARCAYAFGAVLVHYAPRTGAECLVQYTRAEEPMGAHPEWVAWDRGQAASVGEEAGMVQAAQSGTTPAGPSNVPWRN